MFVPLLDRAIEAGGDGPPVLLGPVGKPFMLIFPFGPAVTGEEATLRRFEEWGVSSVNWYFETDHSLPPREIGDKGGALRPLMLMVVKESQKKQVVASGKTWREPSDGQPVQSVACLTKGSATRDPSNAGVVVPGIEVHWTSDFPHTVGVATDARPQKGALAPNRLSESKHRKKR